MEVHVPRAKPKKEKRRDARVSQPRRVASDRESPNVRTAPTLEPQHDFAECLTIDDVARLLKVSKGRAYELVRTGILPSVRLGRSVRIAGAQLRTFLSRGGRGLEAEPEPQ